MKLSEIRYIFGSKDVNSASIMAFVVPLILIVPNIWLDFTETSYSFFAKLTNVFLPLGFYWLVLTAGRSIGRKILYLLPVIAFCCVQIVLLCLYGEAIIAIDMYLNAVTTNLNEAAELFENLELSIGLTACVYVPVLFYAVLAEIKRIKTSEKAIKDIRRIGFVTFLIGALFFALSFTSSSSYRPTRQLFPLNVLCNIFHAADRSEQTLKYLKKSDTYIFHASDSKVAESDSGLIVMIVIGETSRSDHWQLSGYSRQTNPRLSKRNNLVFYPKTLTESNITLKSVPLMLTHLTSKEFCDSIYLVKSIVDAYKEAGYSTAWFSSQGHNHSLIDYFSRRADYVEYLCDEKKSENADPIYDIQLLPKVEKFIDSSSKCEKIFMIVHTYGSHFAYKERYLPEDAVFLPDSLSAARKKNVRDLVNAYDNSLIATDMTLDALMEVLQNSSRPSVLIFAADHGEDIFDDSRNRILHASPNPTYYQLHVPMLVWWNDKYATIHPDRVTTLRENKQKNVSSSESVFHTAIGLSGLILPAYNLTYDLSNPGYHETSRSFLNDYNESVPLNESGLKDLDFQMMEKKNISYK